MTTTCFSDLSQLMAAIALKYGAGASVDGDEIEVTAAAGGATRMLGRVLEVFERSGYSFPDQAGFEEFVVAVYAVALAVAAADREIASAELREIEDFVAGFVKGNLSPATRLEMEGILNHPPDFTGVAARVGRVDRVIWAAFDVVIAAVAAADGAVSGGEERFRAEWERFKATGRG